eukprot:6194872-Pleurochrysis_carterae.AAC.3
MRAHACMCECVCACARARRLEEVRRKKREAEKERRERLRAEGKLLSKSEKAKLAKQQARPTRRSRSIRTCPAHEIVSRCALGAPRCRFT